MPVRETVSSALRAIFSPPCTVRLPINSNDLLTAIISWILTAHPIPTGRLKLTDLKELEDLLVDFAQTWEHGTIIIEYDKSAQIAHRLISQVTVEEVQVNPPLVQKRKRRENSGEPETPVSQNRPEVLDAHHISHDLRQVYMMLQRGTAKGKLLAEQFKSKDSSAFDPICPHVTKDECIKAKRTALPPNAHAEPQRWRQGQQWVPPVAPVTFCEKVHFRALIRPHTDPSLGHCSYLNTCYSEPTYAQSPSIPPPPSANNPNAGRIGNMNAVSLPSGLGSGGRGKEKAPCRYLHFEVDYDGFHGEGGNPGATTVVPIGSKGKNSTASDDVALGIGLGPTGQISKTMTPAQWINCDVRRFDYSVLGKFHVIMADPPWDIHMSLPYGTMTDDEMRAMPIPTLQDEGVIFLWVTGRAMEVGRECLRVWGYTRVDEVVWLKTNQLQRVIRTGRTGHWLNHTKEHMLVGLKTNLDEDGNLKWPSWLNRGLDVDVIVSEVRETSRKPDEVYGVIERMCPGGRKLEIFGRKHNIRPGWLTLGNQLGQDQIHEEDMAERIRARYPERFVRQM
ncbi:hypothetical protein FRB95_010071 [Tulasnella sp. JGI-2019a]|nr:hypothetical protein FRB95_010071 [Tulasnella sp. JGI-2019a]